MAKQLIESVEAIAAAEVSLAQDRTRVAPVVAVCNTNAAQSIPTATWTIVNFATKEIDTDTAVTTGAAWKFTCPARKGGLYHIAASVSLNMGGAAASLAIAVRKNGTEVQRGTRSAAAGAGLFGLVASAYVSVIPTDTVDVVVYQDSGGNQPLEAVASTNRVNIVRVPGDL
jgi:hypothetical protein